MLQVHLGGHPGFSWSPFSFFLFLPFLDLKTLLFLTLCLSYLSYYLPSYLPGAHPFFLTSTCFFNSGIHSPDPGSSHRSPGHPLAWGLGD